MNFPSIFKDLVVVERKGELAVFWFEYLRVSISSELVWAARGEAFSLLSTEPSYVFSRYT